MNVSVVRIISNCLTALDKSTWGNRKSGGGVGGSSESQDVMRKQLLFGVHCHSHLGHCVFRHNSQGSKKKNLNKQEMSKYLRFIVQRMKERVRKTVLLFFLLSHHFNGNFPLPFAVHREQIHSLPPFKRHRISFLCLYRPTVIP